MERESRQWKTIGSGAAAKRAERTAGSVRGLPTMSAARRAETESAAEREARLTPNAETAVRAAGTAGFSLRAANGGVERTSSTRPAQGAEISHGLPQSLEAAAGTWHHVSLRPLPKSQGEGTKPALDEKSGNIQVFQAGQVTAHASEKVSRPPTGVSFRLRSAFRMLFPGNRGERGPEP